MFLEAIELLESAIVEQELDPLPSRHFSSRVLSFDPFGSAARKRGSVPFGKLLQPILSRIFFVDPFLRGSHLFLFHTCPCKLELTVYQSLQNPRSSRCESSICRQTKSLR